MEGGPGLLRKQCLLCRWPPLWPRGWPHTEMVRGTALSRGQNRWQCSLPYMEPICHCR